MRGIPSLITDIRKNVFTQVAKMAYIAYGVNPSLTMNPLLVEKHFSRKHGPGAYYGQAKNEDHK